MLMSRVTLVGELEQAVLRFGVRTRHIQWQELETRGCHPTLLSIVKTRTCTQQAKEEKRHAAQTCRCRCDEDEEGASADLLHNSGQLGLQLVLDWTPL